MLHRFRVKIKKPRFGGVFLLHKIHIQGLEHNPNTCNFYHVKESGCIMKKKLVPLPTSSIPTLISKKSLRRLAAKHPESLLALIILSACGGGSSTEEEVASISYSGAVVKGPLENATVFLDYDGDGVLGADEPFVRTAEDGSFSLSGTVSGVGFVAQTDETTIDTSSGEV